MLDTLRRSLSLRLILIFLTLGALFAYGSVTGIRWVYATDQFRELVAGHLSLHVDYVLRDIGEPPRVDRALAITQRVPVDIRLSGPGLDWASDPAFPGIESLSFASAASTSIDTETWLTQVDGLQLATQGKHRFLKLDQGPYQILVSTPKIADPRVTRQLTPVILGFGLVLVFLAYLAVRWLFKPLGAIRDGAAEIGQGKLGHRIETGRNDQLSDLAGDINTMADNVESMLDAKRQLLLAISHELRSPLSRLRLGLELVGDTSGVDALKDDVVEMEKILSTLLEAERLNAPHSALKYTRISLQETLASLVDDYFSADRARLSVACPQPATIIADAARIVLMLKNLIGNALRYSNQEVSVVVTLDATTCRIAIDDFGPGIPVEQRSSIGEPFYRNDPSRTRDSGGTGLGLYLAKRVATAHQGTLVLDSDYQAGARFLVELPREPDDRPD